MKHGTSKPSVRKNSRRPKTKDLFQDLAIIVLSILIAVMLVETNALNRILTSTEEWEYLGSFLAGIFFTSIFTTAPAIATLGKLSQANNLWSTALFGALGAVVGDLLIFRFVKDRVSEDITKLVEHQSVGKRFKALFKLKLFRWFTFLLGGIIIASPLPDELGISLLGMSKIRSSLFIPLSFVFNFLGILFIGLAARALQ